jgi:hypothetical protein
MGMAGLISFRICLMTAMTGMACLVGAGCSGSHGNGSTSGGRDPFAGMTAPQVLHAAVDGMTLAPSFVLSGGLGQHSGGVDLHLRYLRGQGCVGTINDGSFGNSAIVVIGGAVWTEGDSTFWERVIGRQLPQLVPLLVGKYLKTSASDPIATMGKLCDVKELASFFFPPQGLYRGAVTTYKGRRVLSLRDPSERSTVYVTDTNTPRILAVENTSAQHKGTLTFTYGVAVKLIPPPAGDTLDCAKYGC